MSFSQHQFDVELYLEKFHYQIKEKFTSNILDKIYEYIPIVDFIQLYQKYPFIYTEDKYYQLQEKLELAHVGNIISTYEPKFKAKYIQRIADSMKICNVFNATKMGITSDDDGYYIFLSGYQLMDVFDIDPQKHITVIINDGIELIIREYNQHFTTIGKILKSIKFSDLNIHKFLETGNHEDFSDFSPLWNTLIITEILDNQKISGIFDILKKLTASKNNNFDQEYHKKLIPEICDIIYAYLSLEDFDLLLATQPEIYTLQKYSKKQKYWELVFSTPILQEYFKEMRNEIEYIKNAKHRNPTIHLMVISSVTKNYLDKIIIGMKNCKIFNVENLENPRFRFFSGNLLLTGHQISRVFDIAIDKKLIILFMKDTLVIMEHDIILINFYRNLCNSSLYALEFEEHFNYFISLIQQKMLISYSANELFNISKLWYTLFVIFEDGNKNRELAIKILDQ